MTYATRRALIALLCCVTISACTSTPANYHEPEPGIATSGQIDAEQMDRLNAEGVEVFVCLRPVDEPGTGWEEEHAAMAGIAFARIPLAKGAEPTIDEAMALDKALAATGPDRPVLVYCGSGNRAGALLALQKAWIEDMPADEAIAYGKKAGMTKLTGKVEELLAE